MLESEPGLTQEDRKGGEGRRKSCWRDGLSFRAAPESCWREVVREEEGQPGAPVRQERSVHAPGDRNTHVGGRTGPTGGRAPPSPVTRNPAQGHQRGSHSIRGHLPPSTDSFHLHPDPDHVRSRSSSQRQSVILKPDRPGRAQARRAPDTCVLTHLTAARALGAGGRGPTAVLSTVHTEKRR